MRRMIPYVRVILIPNVETCLEILKSPKINYILNEIMGGGANSVKSVKRQSPYYEMELVIPIS